MRLFFFRAQLPKNGLFFLREVLRLKNNKLKYIRRIYMATLQDLFDEAQYGKEQCEFRKICEDIKHNYDEDTKIFHASGRIKSIFKGTTLTEDVEKVFDHICNKLDNVENRLYNEDVMSPNYRKLQAASIIEDCNKIIAKSNKRGDYVQLPKVATAKAVATAKFFVENYLDDSVVMKPTNNVEFRNLIAEETGNIESIIL